MVGEDVFIGLGSNLGPRRVLITAAMMHLSTTEGFTLVASSAMRETTPEGPDTDQPRFLNAVVHGRTALTPSDLLDRCVLIERWLGRRRDPKRRWGPRRIDLDILLFGHQVIECDGLVVPHPRLAERRFVLEPLAELAGDRIHPGLGRPIQSLVEALGLEPSRTDRDLTSESLS